MSSPFPGMDPFLEGQAWRGFHSRYAACLSELLMENVRPNYVVEIEDYIYLVKEGGEVARAIAPDVWIRDVTDDTPRGAPAAAAVLAEPVVFHLPAPGRIRQKYLTIRTREYHEVVTVIELLSPTNKTPGDGQHDYLTKRENVLTTLTNLVELDLLRGGARPPTVEPLERGDYYAFVTRPPRTPEVDVFSWTLREPMPTIPIPLAPGEAETTLNLQLAFDLTYDRAGYDYSLDYARGVIPPLTEDDDTWVRETLSAVRSPNS